MNITGSHIRNKVQHQAGEWVESFARVGIAAKGVVYLLVGVLAAMAVFTTEGGNGGREGALQAIIEQPFGKILLGIVILGLLGYVTWRMIQTFQDPDGYGTDTKGIFQRAGFFFSGLVYLFFAFSGVRMLFPNLGSGSSESGDDGGGRQMLVAKALEQPFGQWLVGIAAVLLIGKGIEQLYKAYTAKFKRKVNEGQMSHKERTTFIRTGRIGLTARGIVWGILGYFLIQAALQADPSEAKGTEGALDFLNFTGGPYLMAAVALGLAIYGIFMFVMAKYRHMENVGNSH